MGCNIDGIVRDYTFDDAQKRIIEWNLVARGGEHDLSDAALELQWKLVLEEMAELRYAYQQDNIVDFIGEMCDVFVVLLYYIFLNDARGNSVFFPDLFDPEFPPNLEFAEVLENITQHSGDESALADAVFRMVSWVELTSLLNVDIAKALDLVMDSNFSKFHKIGCRIMDDSDYDVAAHHLAKTVEKSYDGKYNDVVGIIVKGVEDDYVVFRADNGKGKILKPLSYNKHDLSCLI